VIAALVVATAASTLLPAGRAPAPGVVRFAVLEGPGPERTLRAVEPFAEYLGFAVRRAVLPSVLSGDRLESGAADFDLALVPAEAASAWPGAEVLAWVSRCRMASAGCRAFVVFRRGERVWHELRAPRLILGDRWTWSGGRGASGYLREHGFELPGGFAKVAYGANPYDHTEALAALAHGAFDVAVACEADVRAAVDEGLLDAREIVFGPAGQPGRDLALVAAPSLAAPARRAIRDAALNLDLYRFETENLRAALVLQALRGLGVEGFSPVEVLPSLRP
jgi:ABC-type phosphate/phosphonate transport system substrate-binding protein